VALFQGPFGTQKGPFVAHFVQYSVTWCEPVIQGAAFFLTSEILNEKMNGSFNCQKSNSKNRENHYIPIFSLSKQPKNMKGCFICSSLAKFG
jgi:hypothetical protein